MNELVFTFTFVYLPCQYQLTVRHNGITLYVCNVCMCVQYVYVCMYVTCVCVCTVCISLYVCNVCYICTCIIYVFDIVLILMCHECHAYTICLCTMSDYHVWCGSSLHVFLLHDSLLRGRDKLQSITI